MLQLKDKCESLLDEKEVIMIKYDVEECIDLIVTRRYKYKEERISYETYDELKEDYVRLLSIILKTKDISTRKLERAIENEKNRVKEESIRQEKLNLTDEKLNRLRSFGTIKECEDYLGYKFEVYGSSGRYTEYKLDCTNSSLIVKVERGIVKDVEYLGYFL